MKEGNDISEIKKKKMKGECGSKRRYEEENIGMRKEGRKR